MSFPSSAENALQTQCSESGDHSGETQRCQNPACNGPLSPKLKHAPQKLYCSTQCTQSASIIKRARELLRGLADDELLKVMRKGD